MLDNAPKALQSEIKEDLRKLYEAVDLDSARKVKDQIIDKYETKASKAATLLDDAFDDITAVMASISSNFTNIFPFLKVHFSDILNLGHC
jgi:putative transposase